MKTSNTGMSREIKTARAYWTIHTSKPTGGQSHCVCGLDNSPGVAFKWSNYLLKSFCQHLCEFTSPGVVVQSMMSNTCIDQSTT